MDWNAYQNAVEFIYGLDPKFPENQSVGWVYIMRNDELKRPLLKIGMTTRPPYDRAADLSNTSIPGHYEVLYFVHVGDARLAERYAHEALVEFRYQPNKEFFAVSVAQAAKVLDELAELMPVLRSQRNKGSRNPRSKPIPQALRTTITDCPTCGRRNRVRALAIPMTTNCGECHAQLPDWQDLNPPSDWVKRAPSPWTWTVTRA